MMLRSASIPLRRAASSWQKPFACRSIGTFFSSTPPSAPTSTPPKDFLSKVEIVEEIAETYDISKAKATKILNTTLDSIVEVSRELALKVVFLCDCQVLIWPSRFDRQLQTVDPFGLQGLVPLRAMRARQQSSTTQLQEKRFKFRSGNGFVSSLIGPSKGLLTRQSCSLCLLHYIPRILSCFIVAPSTGPGRILPPSTH